jgi:hypothetical protein
MVVLSTTADESRRLQSVGMSLCAGFITFLQLREVRWCRAHQQARLLQEQTELFTQIWAENQGVNLPTPMQRQAPYHVDLVNHAWTGLWTAITYTTVLLVRGAWRNWGETGHGRGADCHSRSPPAPLLSRNTWISENAERHHLQSPRRRCPLRAADMGAAALQCWLHAAKPVMPRLPPPRPLLRQAVWVPSPSPPFTAPHSFPKPPPQSVLKGIFPTVALGAGASAALMWWRRRPLAALRAAAHDPGAQRDLRGIYRFHAPDQVTSGAAIASLRTQTPPCPRAARVPQGGTEATPPHPIRPVGRGQGGAQTNPTRRARRRRSFSLRAPRGTGTRTGTWCPPPASWATSCCGWARRAAAAGGGREGKGSSRLWASARHRAAPGAACAGQPRRRPTAQHPCSAASRASRTAPTSS